MRDLYMPGGGPSHLTWRRLGVLVEFLPSESATKTAIRDSMSPGQVAQAGQDDGSGHGPWSHTDFLIRSVLDRLGWVIHAIYRAQGGDPDEPEPFPGPGRAGTNDQPELTPEAAEYFTRLRRDHAESQRLAALEAQDGTETGG